MTAPYAPEGDPEFMPLGEAPRAASYGHALQVLAICLRTGLKSPREVERELMAIGERIRRAERR